MKNIYQLTLDLTKKINDAFRIYQASANQVNDMIELFINETIYTESGKLRYPKKYGTALRMAAYATKETLEQDNIFFCHIVDDKICLRLKNTNSAKINSGLYKVNVTLYEKNSDIDNKVLKGDKKSGFYYLSGKEYFVSKEATQ